jgi:hypothetical protein
MRLAPYKNTDGFMWKCPSKRCNRKRTSTSEGSIFDGAHLTMADSISFIYEWSMGSSTSSICFELSISNVAAARWAFYCREIVLYYSGIVSRDLKIGGPGQVVEIDETMVARRKYNVGRVVEKSWVFGGILRQDGDGAFSCFIEVVTDRKKNTRIDCSINHTPL